MLDAICKALLAQATSDSADQRDVAFTKRDLYRLDFFLVEVYY